MKFRLTFGVKDKNRTLPLNYQYEFASWIYKTIHGGSPEFSKWLHEQGYTSGHKTFKFFTFSNLFSEIYTIQNDRFIIGSDYATMSISFYLSQAAEPFIAGLFKNMEFTIGDKKSMVGFIVKSVEKVKDPEWKTEMSFSTNSPIVISLIDKNISNYAQYLSPDNNKYEQYIIQNLITKYTTLLPMNPDLNNVLSKQHEMEIKFRLTGNFRSKLVKIKADTADETLIKGYTYNFKISAPVELLRIGYFAGFGEKNSLGFGSVEVNNNPI